MKAWAEFVGMQRTERECVSFRLYNVRGEHELAGSTVSVDTLVREGIQIPDMTEEQVETEVALLALYYEEVG